MNTIDAICMIITAEPFALFERALPLFVWHQRRKNAHTAKIYIFTITKKAKKAEEAEEAKKIKKA